jgi:hypothetical protein
MKVKFDPFAVTMGDLKTFEELSGKSFEEEFNLPWRAPMGVYYLIMRQNDPTYTSDQLDALTLGDVMAMSAAVDELDKAPVEG